MLDMKNTHWAEDGEQQTFPFPNVSEEKKKKGWFHVRPKSELDEIFSESRANNHRTPQPPKCLGWVKHFVWCEMKGFILVSIQFKIF